MFKLNGEGVVVTIFNSDVQRKCIVSWCLGTWSMRERRIVVQIVSWGQSFLDVLYSAGIYSSASLGSSKAQWHGILQLAQPPLSFSCTVLSWMNWHWALIPTATFNLASFLARLPNNYVFTTWLSRAAREISSSGPLLCGCIVQPQW